MKNWAYKVLQLRTAENSANWERDLNELGTDGWELVKIVQTPNILFLFLKKPQH